MFWLEILLDVVLVAVFVLAVDALVSKREWGENER